jgi:iron-sulfur cluster assembly accessory protein
MIEVTDEALAKAIQKSEDDGRSVIRVGVTGGGCAGFEYIFRWDEATPADYIVDYGKIKFAIDELSRPYIEGSTITWEQLGLNEQFKIINPKEQSACGCGVSIIFDETKIQQSS